MFRRSMILTALGAVALASAVATPAQAAEETYYLALGDSLAAGAQPVGTDNATVATDEGYADQLYAKLKENDPNLKLVKLGCVGETAKSFVQGGVCSYSGANSQLGAAKSFLKKNGAKVKYVTVSIGAQEVYGCIKGASADIGCMLKGLASAGLYMPQVTAGIRLATNSKTRLMGMNWYNPGVMAWLLGEDGKSQAKQSELLNDTLNLKMAINYGAWGFKLADVCADWRCKDWTEDTPYAWPRNVWDVATRTWIVNVESNWLPKVHGYGFIANVFAGISG